MTTLYDAIMYFENLKVRESLHEQLVEGKHKTWREKQKMQYDHVVDRGSV